MPVFLHLFHLVEHLPWMTGVETPETFCATESLPSHGPIPFILRVIITDILISPENHMYSISEHSLTRAKRPWNIQESKCALETSNRDPFISVSTLFTYNFECFPSPPFNRSSMSFHRQRCGASLADELIEGERLGYQVDYYCIQREYLYMEYLFVYGFIGKCGG